MAPTGLSQIEKQNRRDRIVAAREAGQTLREMARTYEMSIEGVRKILVSSKRAGLCPGQGVRPQPRPGKDKWFRKKWRIQADLRTQRILALRRQMKSWAEIAALVYHNDSDWGATHCMREVQRAGARHNLNVGAAFYNLCTKKAQYRKESQEHR